MSALIEDPVEIAVVDYGMGNRRSVEKALEHVGARASVSSRPRRAARGGRLVVPGVGAFPRGDGASARARPRRAAARARRRRHAAARICLGMQLAFEHSSELGGADGLGLIAGEVRGLRTAALKLPHIGWNEVRFAKPRLAALDGLPSDAPSTTCTASRPCPTSEQDVLGTAEYGEPFVTVVAQGLVLRRPVPPREVLGRTGCACSPTSRDLRRGARSRAPAARVNLYPAIDILGGNAVRLSRATSTAKKVYDQEPLAAARALAQAAGASACTSSTSTAREPASRSTSSTCARSPASSAAGPVRRRAALARARSSEALDAGAARVILGTAAFTDPELLERALAAHGRAVLVSVDVRGGRVATHGWTGDARRCRRERRSQRCARARRAQHFVYTDVDRDGMLDGADLEEVELRRAGGRRRAADLLRRDRRARRPARRSRRCAEPDAASPA